MNGLPVLSGLGVKPTASILLGTAQLKIFEALSLINNQWGIYPAGDNSRQNGFGENIEQVVLSTRVLNTTIGDIIGGGKSQNVPVVEIDSMVMLDARSDTQVSDYRLEMGGYASYNKVPQPEQINVVMTRGGRLADRTAFIEWLDKNVAETSVYNIVTPEKVFKDVTLESYEVLRESQRGGASLIEARCVFRQIRQVKAIVSGEKATTENAQSANDVPTTKPEQKQADPSSILDNVVGTVTKGFEKATAYIEGIF
ncbi:MAG: hypothetical protein NC112_09050 [Oxalobacter formigenes]|nr:hypothetical protein [Oxalobacter formigenes]